MKISLICFTRAGFETMKRIASACSDLPEESGERNRSFLWVAGKYALQLAGEETEIPYEAVREGGLSDWTKDQFQKADALIFVGACGIAVRAIAPFVCDKFKDPAVLCVDEAGKFVVPLLSGHVGGANRLAEFVADKTGAVPVITTATDVEKKFAVDVFAKDHGLLITDRVLAKKISSDILADEPVGVFSDFTVPDWKTIPKGLFKDRICKRNLWITISEEGKKNISKDRLLRLVPRCVAIGIGCRRETPEEKIREAVEHAAAHHGIDPGSIFAVASIDIKKQEQGIIQFAKSINVPFLTFTSEELNGQPGTFTESEFVRKTTGTGNVCERAAVAACRLGTEDVHLLFQKEAGDGVTVAAAYYGRI